MVVGAQHTVGRQRQTAALPLENQIGLPQGKARPPKQQHTRLRARVLQRRAARRRRPLTLEWGSKRATAGGGLMALVMNGCPCLECLLRKNVWDRRHYGLVFCKRARHTRQDTHCCLRLNKSCNRCAAAAAAAAAVASASLGDGGWGWMIVIKLRWSVLYVFVTGTHTHRHTCRQRTHALAAGWRACVCAHASFAR